MKQEIINYPIEGYLYAVRHPLIDLMGVKKLLRLTLTCHIQEVGALTLQCQNVEKT